MLMDLFAERFDPKNSLGHGVVLYATDGVSGKDHRLEVWWSEQDFTNIEPLAACALVQDLIVNAIAALVDRMEQSSCPQ